MTNETLLERVENQAKQEIAEEDFLELVKKHKVKLREYKPFWHKVFPWKIHLIRR